MQERRRNAAKAKGRVGGNIVDDAGSAKGKDNSVLWGMGNDELPIDPAIAEAHIRQKLGISQDREAFGFRSWGPAFEEPFLRHMLATDQGA